MRQHPARTNTKSGAGNPPPNPSESSTTADGKKRARLSATTSSILPSSGFDLLLLELRMSNNSWLQSASSPPASYTPYLPSGTHATASSPLSPPLNHHARTTGRSTLGSGSNLTASIDAGFTLPSNRSTTAAREHASSTAKTSSSTKQSKEGSMHVPTKRPRLVPFSEVGPARDRLAKRARLGVAASTVKTPSQSAGASTSGPAAAPSMSASASAPRPASLNTCASTLMPAVVAPATTATSSAHEASTSMPTEVATSKPTCFSVGGSTSVSTPTSAFGPTSAPLRAESAKSTPAVVSATKPAQYIPATSPTTPVSKLSLASSSADALKPTSPAAPASSLAASTSTAMSTPTLSSEDAPMSTLMSTSAFRPAPSKYEDYTRHASLWHSDGSVVLAVDKMLFKLHTSRLSHESNYFADLFKVGPTEQSTIDGCPMFLVAGVSASDFAVLMETMDGGVLYTFEPPSFLVIASLLRAARILSFPKILKFAKHSLCVLWPADLPSLASACTPHAAQTILLARQCDVPSTLKRAYYELLRSPYFSQPQDDDDDMYAGPAPLLGTADYARLVAARERLQDAWVRAAAGPPDVSCARAGGSDGVNQRKPDPDAPSTRCLPREAAATLWGKVVVRGDVFREGLRDPLCALKELAGIEWGAHGYCEKCVGAMRAFWREKREEIWRDLDTSLGLD